MNTNELKNKVTSAMYTLIRDKGFVSPVEVLIEVGVLSKEDYENWRFGRTQYLEKVCKINLHKLSTVMHEIRAYAQKNNLKPSWTAYQKWGKGESVRLRFSKSGDERIERNYATHYISQTMAEAARERKVFKKQNGE